MRFFVEFRAAVILVIAGITHAKPQRKVPPIELTGDDMIYRPWQRNGLVAAKRWLNAEVPYVFDAALSGDHITAINEAIQSFNQLTCIRFIPKLDQHKDYIRFMVSKDNCYSYVGRVGGSQDLSLDRGCLHHGIIVHEMEHALGFKHEQCRPDRDDYIIVRYDRIKPSNHRHFDKLQPSEAELQGLRYDYLSVMHYSNSFYSENGEDTIITLDKEYQYRTGRNNNFTQCDLEKINRRYECTNYILPDNPCKMSTVSTSTATSTTSAPASCKDEPYYRQWCEWYIVMQKKPEACQKTVYANRCKKSCNKC